jgi:hypothetical protein
VGGKRPHAPESPVATIASWDLEKDDVQLMNVVYPETAAAFEGLTLEGADDDLTWQSEDA